MPPAARVSVGLGLRGQVEADGQRAARTVVDYDLLTKLLAELGTEDARDRVGGAAGGLRDDEPDRLVRVLRRRAGGERARKQQQDHSKRAHIAFLHAVLRLRRGVTSVMQPIGGTTHLLPLAQGAAVLAWCV